jgi:hypothetical protein
MNPKRHDWLEAVGYLIGVAFFVAMIFAVLYALFDIKLLLGVWQ